SRRGDVGELWENFLVVERLKKQKYSNQFANNYFWRTYSQQEIDWVEDKDGQLNGYEFKWGKKSGKIPPSWKESYPKAVFDTINKDNYLDFITYDLG
ncbi:MAG: DUF4143 domain-containing protein, partial [Patescibacteria group bacterium]